MAWRVRSILSVLALGVLGCGGGIIEAATDELGEGDSGSETPDEIGDVETGTSSGAESTSADGSTLTDGSTSDESTSDESTSDESTSTESTTTESTTTESTTTESTTTDTVVDTACNESVSFIIPAVDYTSVYGWTETLSEFGEGMVLSIPNQVNEAVATYDIDIPCDDTWHIWVRGIEQGGSDSYWVRVEGQPQGWAIFELDCTTDPAESAYKWTQLNWRDPNANSCQYVEDPWVHDWGVGVYELEIGYRDSWAISKIWVSNTNDNPP